MDTRDYRLPGARFEPLPDDAGIEVPRGETIVNGTGCGVANA
jgi:hypothetical protein